MLKADNDKDIYLVFEYMEINLHAVIKAGQEQEGGPGAAASVLCFRAAGQISRLPVHHILSGILEPVHKTFIMYQQIKAIKYMHSGDVSRGRIGNLPHRDIISEMIMASR